MITSINAWTHRGAVTAMVMVNFDLFTGKQQPEYSRLAVMIGGQQLGFTDSKRFDESVVNAELPEFDPSHPEKIDLWLREYARRVDEFVSEFGAPEPGKEI